MKIGVDIGGTKCSVVIGDHQGVYRKIYFETTSVEETLVNIQNAIHSLGKADSIGISCGGPLDMKRGIIQSPPNLIGWDDIPITEFLSNVFNIPAYLCNDADACALAEHRYGSGRGVDNMIFLTFGTGMGAGLILNGKLYSGTCGMAGEIGHVRLENYGPVGYGKSGSFEGFCSGGGIAQLGKSMIRERMQQGIRIPYCPNIQDMDHITAKFLADQARAGDPLAKEVYRISGEMLGRGVSILLDVLNPEMIIIGSIFSRSTPLLEQYMVETIKKEALFRNRIHCAIVSSGLGDNIGDYAALAVAHGI